MNMGAVRGYAADGPEDPLLHEGSTLPAELSSLACIQQPPLRRRPSIRGDLHDSLLMQVGQTITVAAAPNHGACLTGGSFIMRLA